MNVLDTSKKIVIFSECVTNLMYVWSDIVCHSVCRTAQSALDFTPWHTCSFPHKFCFSGKHSAMLQLLCEHFTRESPAFYNILFADMLFADFILLELFCTII